MSFKPQQITDINNWKVFHTRKKRKKHGNSSENLNEISLSNSFDALDDSMGSGSSMKTDAANIKIKKKKIPPLVIYTYIQEHVNTLKEMEKDLKEEIDVKCKNNRIIMYTKNEEDYKTK